MTRESIRDRLAKATPGPWVADGKTVHFDPVVLGEAEGYDEPYLLSRAGTIYDEGGHTAADADLIAHAPTDIAALLAVADAAELLSRGNDGDTMCCLLAVASDGLRHGDCAWDDLRAALAALEALP